MVFVTGKSAAAQLVPCLRAGPGRYGRVLQRFVAYVRYVNGLPGGHPDRVAFGRSVLYAVLAAFVLWVAFGR